jgi:1-phosphofructokinase family hexose kinase
VILCVNANAAIDKTVVVSPFRLNAIHRPRQVLALAGGKGANVARALQRLGEHPVVAGWGGGYNGQFIAAGLHAEGIETAFVELAGESRTCLSILDPAAGTLTEIYEQGEPVPAAALAAFTDLFREIAGRYAAITLSGTLPPGVPTGFYSQLLATARAAGVPGLLDSSGEALRQGLATGAPLLIKPNTTEFAELVGQKLASATDIAAAATDVALRYGTIVVVSLGAGGLLAATGGEVVHARPPQVPIVSAVGSGDCTLAGITYGLVRGWPLVDALRYGVAAGTANALSLGAGVFTLEDFERVRAQVTVTQ